MLPSLHLGLALALLVSLALGPPAEGAPAAANRASEVVSLQPELATSAGGSLVLAVERLDGGDVSVGGSFRVERAGSARLPGEIFADGFESGGVSAWSQAVPPPSPFPRGAVVFHLASSCPDGWSPLSEAAGRAVVGLPLSGTLGATVGTAFGDLGVTGHGHMLRLLETSTVDGAHSHNWAWLFTTGTHKQWRSRDINGNSVLLIDWSNGVDAAGSGHYPLASVSGGTTWNPHTDLVGAHAHTLDRYEPTDLWLERLPYVQLLACEKE